MRPLVFHLADNAMVEGLTAFFRRVYSAVSRRALDRCQEPGFQLLRRTLRTWFPPEEGAA